ncbi:MAG: WD40 repeat domain-containing protein [Planctomycetota bacterium]|jgi:WD40 repeat protein
MPRGAGAVPPGSEGGTRSREEDHGTRVVTCGVAYTSSVRKWTRIAVVWVVVLSATAPGRAGEDDAPSSGLALVATLEGHDTLVRCLAFSPDGGALVSGASDRTLRLWRGPDWTLARTLTLPRTGG